MSASPAPPRAPVPGLHRERTTLSWRRTALASAAAGVAVVRLAVDRGMAPAVVALAALLVGGVVTVLAAGAAASAGPASGRGRRSCAAAAGVLALGLVVVVTGLARPA